jgi:S-adenosyl-L-methionine hydrolase (adenosine-forming)
VRVTLLTDFGTRDGYVAAMKGAISALAPAAIVDDATHDIAAGDIPAGAWVLAGYWRIYEPPVVHVAVVDPGVGGGRQAIAARADGRLLVGPDNGIFTRVFHAASELQVVRIEGDAFTREAVSSTFHGRDVFAPVAAHLSLGLELERLGPLVDNAVLLELPVPRRDHSHVHGEVIHVDRFGNLITNIPAELAGAGARVIVCGRMCGMARTYSDAPPGELLALDGSRGMLEVSIRDGDAASFLAAGRGAAVIVEAGT